MSLTRILGYLLISLPLWNLSLPAQNITFAGNDQYSSQQLQNVIAKEWADFQKTYDISYVDDANYKLKNYYHEQGYCFATVDYQVEAEKQVTFFIEEHQKVLVQEVKIVPSSLFFPHQELREFLSYQQKDQVFLRGKAEQDAAAIQKLYHKKGFLDMQWQVKHSFSPAPPHSQKVKITIHIEQGLQHFVTSLQFQGNHKFSDTRLDQVAKFPGRTVYTPGLERKFEARLLEFYRNYGYAYINITITSQAQVQQQSKEVTLVYRFEEGNKCRIRSLTIQGNALTQKSKILQNVLLQPGDEYDLQKIRDSERYLQKTGLFLFVEIQEQEASAEAVDLLIKVEERESQVVSLSLGYNTTYGVVTGISYENINIWGSGKRFLVSLESSLFTGELAESEFRVSLLEPQLFSYRTLSGEVQSFLRYEETPTFSLLSRGAGVFLEKTLIEAASPFYEYSLNVGIGYNLEFSEILEVEDDELEREEGLTIISSIQERIVFDGRDDFNFPTTGFYLAFEFEQSFSKLLADVDYARTYYEFAWYYSLWSHSWSDYPVVLALSCKAGVIIPFGDTDEVPIQKRFFGGGPAGVRSFQEQQMPPLDASDNPVGGEGLFLASAELRIPIYGSLGISPFVDLGQIIPQVRTFEDYRLSQLEYAVGISIWYNTLIGPIRFDYAINPDVDENPLNGEEEDRSAWFISIGFSF